ncbi:hypothetical protein KEM54_001860 [Ascosphaera aggregata]|nr:hypothetical protein KEM54_001860 [Ascosphaera aggregata]
MPSAMDAQLAGTPNDKQLSQEDENRLRPDQRGSIWELQSRGGPPKTTERGRSVVSRRRAQEYHSKQKASKVQESVLSQGKAQGRFPVFICNDYVVYAEERVRRTAARLAGNSAFASQWADER